MDFIDENVLEIAGFNNTSPMDYSRKAVILRDGRHANVWVHEETGHGILDVQFWEDQDYYNQGYRKEFGAKLDERLDPIQHLTIYKDLNEKQFNTFSSKLTKDTKFLEIGSSFGGILNKVVNAGVEVCHGVEPNKRDAEFVSKNNGKAKIYNSRFEDAQLSAQYYDIVVGIEVLEHVVSPRFFIKKCFDVLCPNGLIYIEVPNHNDVLLSTYNNVAYQRFFYHKAHIHYFTEKSLLSLFSELGFEADVSSFLMYPFFNHVWWLQNNTPQESADLALSNLVPTNGNTPAQKAINNFYEKVEMDYENLINSNMLGDCLILQGQKII